MVILPLALLLGQVDVQPRATPAGRAPAIAHSPVDARVNDAIFFLFETQLEGVSELDFEVQRNDARLLVLSVSGESCGAYCESFTKEACFDLRSGRLLAIDDLVTPKGLGKIASAMQAERKRRYRAEVKANRIALAATPASDNAVRQDLEDRLALNEDCAEQSSTYDVRYSIGAKDTIRVTAGRCSNHAMRALDDVGEVRLELPAAKLDLTPYGRWLLAGGPDVPEPTKPFGQVLHGTVGTAKVTMLLETPDRDGSLRGQYIYDKHRKPIELHGSVNGPNASFAEASGKFVVTVRNSGLSGTWNGNGKELPVVLER